MTLSSTAGGNVAAQGGLQPREAAFATEREGGYWGGLKQLLYPMQEHRGFSPETQEEKSMSYQRVILRLLRNVLGGMILER